MAVERKVRLPNELGLHARPAMQLVERANEFTSSIRIVMDGHEVDGKIMIAVLTLGAEQGSEILIVAEGEDEQEAVEALCGLIEVGFGEE